MRSIFKSFVYGSIPALMLTLGGCGDFFAEKPTELQANRILAEVSKIKEDLEVVNPVPKTYSEPAQILNTPKGLKLFYFTKHHSPDILAELVKSQLGNAYSTNVATNQLIVTCSSQDDAKHVLEFLKRVDLLPIQVKIDCMIVENYSDVTMDWETTVQIENLLGEDVTLVGKENNDYLAFPGASIREELRSTFGLNIGYDNNGKPGHIVNAVVDLLVSRGYFKVLMNPEVETINGKEAYIVSRDRVPITKIVSGENDAPYQITEYIYVEDSLKVTPHVYSDGSIGLKTEIKMGSKSTPEGVVQLPIITERSITVQENRLKPGNSLIIGGFKKTEKRSVVRGVPFLKDLPIIGVLFSSKDFEEKGKDITFILTPSISSNGIKYSKMVDKVREMTAEPEYDAGFDEFINDPFGTGCYTKEVEKQVQREEIKRIRAEIEVAETELEAESAREKLREFANKADVETRRAEKAKIILAKTKAELKALNEEKQQLLKEKQEIEKKVQQTEIISQKKVDEIKKNLEAANIQTAQKEAKLKQIQKLYEDLKKKMHQESENSIIEAAVPADVENN